MKKRYPAFHNLLLYSVFVLYLFVFVTFKFMRGTSSRTINMIPFHIIYNYLYSDDLIVRSFTPGNMIGNIFLFVPLGIYITLFSRNKHMPGNVLKIIVFSILVESVQFIFKSGIADIDDVLLNTLGGFCGIIIYHTMWYFFKDEDKVRYAIELAAPIVGIVFFILFWPDNML